MNTRLVTSYEALTQQVGRQIGVSDWVEVSQSLIDAFATVSGDDGFIHVNVNAAAKTQFGQTIAQGLLTLSLTGLMGKEVIPVITDRNFLLNYGYDKIRFLSPVPSGARIRACYTLVEATVRSDKQRLLRFQITIECDASRSPAMVADWLLMVALK